MSQFKTPLRYPGGKQKLTPFVLELLNTNHINGHYCEPYAGGAGVAIELLLAKKINHVHLNDFDYGIYCFWHSILNRTEEFCKLLTTASMTVKEWQRHKAIVKKCDKRRKLEIGFSIFYLNRCNRSGVLAGGVIGGLDQTGNYKMDARFNRNDLIRRIECIAMYKNQISITNFDAEYYIENYIPNLPDNSLIYLDPPYYEKGKQLYPNAYKKSDHARLADVIQSQIQHNWILSYDGVPDIVDLYTERRHFLYDLRYSAANVYMGKEIFIFCDRMNLPLECKIPQIHSGLQTLLNQ